jgi:hypothetical protein
MESFDVDHPSIELGIRLQELPKRLRRNIPATRNGYMWMPGAKLRFETDDERGLLHSFVNLKQVRVRPADANPDNFRPAFCGKRPNANNWQKERAKFDCAEFLAQLEIGFVRDFSKETERKMHLRRIRPVHAANVRIMTRKQFAG